VNNTGIFYFLTDPIFSFALHLNIFRNTERLNERKSKSSWQGLMEHFKEELLCIIIAALLMFTAIHIPVKVT